MPQLRRVVVVGASLAGLWSARALRAEGFDGDLVVVGAEPHAPYDRPPLSKGVLLGTSGPADLALAEDGDEDLGVDWRLGVPAAGLDTDARAVLLADGGELPADGVVVATGARARRPPGLHDAGALPAGVHVLRTLEDATALAGELRPGRHLAVVGGGLLGGEVAAAGRARGLEVTVLDRGDAPVRGVFGARVGDAVARRHTAAGVRWRTGAAVTGVGTGAGGAPEVRLAGGEVVAADVVVAAVGADPATDWLRDARVAGADREAVELADPALGVVTDDRGATAAPWLVAVGDAAAVRGPDGRARREEHWTPAVERPAVAARTLLSGGASTDRFGAVPYVWSDLRWSGADAPDPLAVRVQLAGRPEPGDEESLVEGGPEEGPLVAAWHRDGRLTAVAALSSPRTFGRLRRELRRAAATTG
ncbi:NAD(P)/FAD-dependent oxidoreductase [Kineococcus terrestris]|uniref:NAD(P)/FAD-dependent oxidoreductase n=1 Tax=Kineococcus terrestris TaxID=2044856 RepID=UPI0034DB6344